MIKKMRNSYSIQIIFAMIAGVTTGIFVPEAGSYMNLTGNIFLHIFQLFVVFYVMATVSGAVLIGDAQDIGKMGIHTFKWIMIFTLISAFIGAGLSIIMKPGDGVLISQIKETSVQVVADASLPDYNNFVYKLIHLLTEGSMVPFIVLALFFGVAMGAYAKESRNPVMLTWIQKIYVSANHLMKVVIRFVPIGIFCLIGNAATNLTLDLVFRMSRFLLLLLVGNLLQFTIMIPVTCILTKTEIKGTILKLRKLSFLALTTTSGAVCLPVKNEEEVVSFGISRKVADFTGPITMSMNSCGAVQCYVAAIFFLAQSAGKTLTGYQVLTAIFLSILMCLGTISVPGGSAMVYAFLAASLGLSVEGIAILVGIDWIAGMLRTLMNVDVDVLVGMLVASKLGELDYNVFFNKKKATYV